MSQVLSPNDVAQLNFYYAHQSGYLTDPYKVYWGVDNRPVRGTSSRYWHAGTTISIRPTRPCGCRTATIRTTGRSWPTRSRPNRHSGLPDGWVLTPNLRYTTQSAAYFYFDPIYDAILGAPFPPGYLTNPDGFYSADQRLSAFGGITAGLKLSDIAGPDGSSTARPGFLSGALTGASGARRPRASILKAQIYQVGVTRKFSSVLVYAIAARSHVHSDRNGKSVGSASDRPCAPPIGNCKAPSPAHLREGGRDAGLTAGQ